MIVTIKDVSGDCMRKLPNRQWVHARPINYKHRSFLERLREAYLVFSGKCDPFMWEEDRINGECAKETSASPEPQLDANISNNG